MDKGGRMGSTLHMHACWNKDCAADLRRDRREDLCLKTKQKSQTNNTYQGATYMQQKHLAS